MKVLYDRVLVERKKAEAKSVNGIYLPDSSANSINHGTVIAVGHGRFTSAGKIIPLVVAVGDEVIFTRHAGTDIGDEQIVLREDEILGIME